MKYLIVLLLSMLVAVVLAADADYIVALKKPVTKEKMDKVRAAIENMGGKINHEITLGIQGFAVSLPTNQIQAFEASDDIDFVEQDQAVHAFK